MFIANVQSNNDHLCATLSSPRSSCMFKPIWMTVIDATCSRPIRFFHPNTDGRLCRKEPCGGLLGCLGYSSELVLQNMHRKVINISKVYSLSGYRGAFRDFISFRCLLLASQSPMCHIQTPHVTQVAPLSPIFSYCHGE